jgi:predicted secreted protein
MIVLIINHICLFNELPASQSTHRNKERTANGVVKAATAQFEDGREIKTFLNQYNKISVRFLTRCLKM